MSKGIYIEYIYTHTHMFYIYIHTHPKEIPYFFDSKTRFTFDIPELQMHLIITGMSYWKNF